MVPQVCGIISHMVAPMQRTRRRPTGTRRTNGASETFRVRLSPEHRRLAELGADARGVTLARYTEILIEGDEIARAALEKEKAEQLVDQQSA